MKKKSNFFRTLLFLIGLSFILLGTMPYFLGPGLTNPEPIGPYLNGVFPASPPSEAPYGIAFPNLRFDSPLTFTLVPDQNRIVVGQRDGKIYWFDNDQNTVNKNLLVDLSDEVGVVWDGGFLGLAIHPDFGTSGSNFFYVFYSTEDSNSNDFPNMSTIIECNSEEYWGNSLILERFEVNPNTLTIISGSRNNLIKIRMYGTTHRGGGLLFGNDGFLYLSTGDQTARIKSQDIVNNLDGGVLRLDVDKDPTKSHPPIRTIQDHGYPDEISGLEYWIPNDNPFPSPDGSHFEEYYTIGHRNPHRMTKDKETGVFYIGEIGEITHEEINVLSKGKNYGWPVYEGHEARGNNCGIGLYNNMAHEPPLVSFPRSDANAIIGGYVYRGSEIPDLYGTYICADYGSGEEIWSVDTQTGNYTLLGNFSPADIMSFGEDVDGNIYILKQGDNVNLYQLLPSTISYDGIPENLSETGAFQDLQTLSVSEGLIPFDLIDPFWSDGAHKARWMAIPNDGTHNTPDEKINFSEDGDWDFPVGSVLIKHFDLAIDDTNPDITQKIETRFSIKGQDGKFYFLTYNWNDQQTEATLQKTAIDEPVAITTQSGGTRYQNWHYPSNTECIACHKAVTKGSLGPRTRYLNSDITYDKTNITANQLVTLSYLGILDQTITDDDTSNFLTYKSIYDTNATLDEKARSYLDLNCAYCHRPGTGNRSNFDLRLFNSLEETGLLTAGTNTPLGIDGEKIVVPGDASKSILYHRTNSIDPTIMMPPLAKGLVDDEAVVLIQEWINQLGGPTNERPVAVVSSDITSGSYPLQVSFTGSSSTDDNGIVAYSWDFGDGTSTSEADSTHTYETEGTFIATLTVTDSEGLSDSASVTITVTAPNLAPMAVAEATPSSGDAPLEISFSGSGSNAPVGMITSYAWDFGDGIGTSDQMAPSYTYTVPGDYTVTLVVTDNEQGSDSTTLQIVVMEAPNQAPVAVAEAAPSSGDAPLEVTFSSNGSYDPNGNIMGYSWDFGDGVGTSDQANTSYTYNEAGIYTVTLTVTDDELLDATVTLDVIVAIGDEKESLFDIRVYPNPTGAILKISKGGEVSDLQLIELFDATGRAVIKYDAASIKISEDMYEISVENLPAGVYFLRFVAQDAKPYYKQLLVN